MMMDYQTQQDGPDEPTGKAAAIDTLIELLAPVLTHHQGMAARGREDRFRAALNFLFEYIPA